ncbi:hypothetical protein [Brevibacterium sandarakinum]|uniref:hypothetical protein n=1 Tax=Brevibacterium sandarakinum TaxID=629680 RepID=UPI0015607222|nr:hypothetical protein [Brevibacterium sandarakinum]
MPLSMWAGVSGIPVAVTGASWAFPLDGEGISARAATIGPTVIEVAAILVGVGVLGASP